MKTDIQHKKIEIIQWLAGLNDAGIVSKLLQIKEHFTNNIPLSDDEMQSLLKGIDDADNGKLISHKQAKKIYEKWL